MSSAVAPVPAYAPTRRPRTSPGGWLTVVGGLAWVTKVAVIASNHGEHATTGAAAWLMRLGLVSLGLGAVAMAVWTARRRGLAVRVAAAALAPVAMAATMMAVGAASTAAVEPLVRAGAPGWLRLEAGIVGAGIVAALLGAAHLAAGRRAGRAA